MEDYAKEGLANKTVPLADNQPVIDLLIAVGEQRIVVRLFASCHNHRPQKPSGIFFLIDEEANFPKATNTTLLNKFIKSHEKNKSFVRSRGPTQTFGIRHYAGAVTYSINGFLEKNRDTLHADMQQLMQGSTNQLLADMFEPSALDPKKQAKFITIGYQFTVCNGIVNVQMRTSTHVF